MTGFNPYSPQYYCCCGKKGCIAVGIFESICVLIALLHLIGQMTRFKKVPDGYYIHMAVVLVFLAIMFILIVMLFIGVKKENPSFLAPHLGWQLLGIFLTIITIILAVILIISSSAAVADWLSGGAASAYEHQQLKANTTDVEVEQTNSNNNSEDHDDKNLIQGMRTMEEWKTRENYIIVDPKPVKELDDNGNVISYKNGYRLYGAAVLVSELLSLFVQLWLFTVVYGAYRLFRDQQRYYRSSYYRNNDSKIAPATTTIVQPVKDTAEQRVKTATVNRPRSPPPVAVTVGVTGN